MENAELHKILARYLSGESTREEQAIVERWYASLDRYPDDVRLQDRALEQALEEKMLEDIRMRLALEPAPDKPRVRFFTPVRIAAGLLLLALAASTLFFMDKDVRTLVRVDYVRAENSIVTLHNTTTRVQMHVLSDGSTIALQPRGTITFPRRFDGNKRSVSLEGEAFFEVTKDKSRPFVINAHDVMVRVLGTSFNVRAYEGDSEVKVAVKTGKVSVTRQSNDYAPTAVKEIILTPNQEVIYNTVNEHFSKQIVATPQIILARPTLFEMKYDGTPVDKIFEVMEDNYGIDIVFDAKVLSSCTLTTSMSEEGFHERIEVICQAIGATYETRDAKILIKSNGCQETNH